MKELKEIERLGIEELERMADDVGVEVPAGLTQRVRSALTASALAGETSRSRAWRRPLGFSLAASALAALTLVLALPGRGPKDTFDDPRTAYAELERTLSYISEKMNGGTQLARDASAVINKPREIIDKITEK